MWARTWKFPFPFSVVPLDDVIGRFQNVDDVDSFLASSVVLQLDVDLRRSKECLKKTDSSNELRPKQSDVTMLSRLVKKTTKGICYCFLFWQKKLANLSNKWSVPCTNCKKGRQPISRIVHRVLFWGNFHLNHFWWKWFSVKLVSD